MRRELPSPDEILEQLADKTALQIDRLAPVAFDAALDELTRYHRFLLNVNATRAPDGTPFNYASVAGGAWRSPHNDWINQYRRLFESAASHIGDAPDFLEKLAHVPARLLPRRDDPEMPSEVLQAILDLGIILVHQIEAWVTKRTVADIALGSAAAPRTYLAGSEAKSYANLLPNLVGAWESLLTAAPAIYNWQEDSPAEAHWNSLQKSWPFLWKHLSNTAYMLAVSVWNEDEAGVAFHRDALVRWPQTLSHDFVGITYFLNRRRVFPDILSLDLQAAKDRIKPSLQSYAPEPSPRELFGAVLQGAHDDVLLLTAALLLLWSMEEKQVTGIGAHTAAALLRRQLEDTGDEFRQTAQDNSFAAAMLDVIRIELAGDHYPKGTYGADLDYLVARLDNMTERRVVPGRVFTPSTANGRHDLQAAILAILLGRISGTDDGVLQKQVQEISDDEASLPRGDRSLRDILHSLDRFQNTLTTAPQFLERGFHLMGSSADFSASSNLLKSTIRSIAQTIEEARNIRLKQKPIDTRAINELRDAAQQRIMTSAAHPPHFKDFAIETTKSRNGSEVFRIRYGVFSKAQFVDPPMISESSGFTNQYGKMIAERAGVRIWGLFARRQRVATSVPLRLAQSVFWERIRQLAKDVGAEPIFLVSRHAQNRLRNVVELRDGSDVAFKVERKPYDQRGNGYVATIEGIDVYSADLKPGKAWLFSPYLLQSVQYAPANEAGDIVSVTFQPSNDLEGALVAEFYQRLVWSDWTVYEIDYDESES